MTHLPVVMVGIALLGAYLVPVASARKGWAPWLALGITSLCFAGSLVLARSVGVAGPARYNLGGWPPPWGIEVWVDGPGAFMLVTIGLVMLASLVYASQGLRYEAHETSLPWFWALNLLLLAGMMGMVMARDLFNLFVFVEVTSLAACGIVSVKKDGRALESTLRYLILSALGTGALLFGVALIYMATGHLNMEYIAAGIPEALASYPGNAYAGLGFVTVGFGVKAALFPLHTWLPDAHSDAPAPSSAILSGLVVKVFAFAYWRVLTLALAPMLAQIPIGMIIAFMGALASVAGSVLAMVQGDLKRLLAYSTIAQVGCIFVGFGLGGQQAVTGALMHIMAHGMMKAGLFLAVGCIMEATGGRGIDDMAGLGKSMPLVMAAFLVMSLSMVGIPPLAGFASKWHLIVGAIGQGQVLLAGVLVLTSLLTMLYLFPLLVKAYFHPGPDRVRVPLAMEAPVVALAALVIIMGFFPGIMLGLMGS